MLLYVTLVIAVGSVAAAAVMPVAGSIVEDSLEADSSEQVIDLSFAITRYYEDNHEFPGSLFDLVQKPEGAKNWLGGYIRKRVSDQKSESLSLAVDGWRQPYTMVPVDPWTRKLVSPGSNGIMEEGEGDDISHTFSVHPILWRMTKEEIEDINRAITAYNENEDVPLFTGSWTSILSALETGGYIVTGEAPEYDYMHDGWGQTYVPVGNPVVSVTTLGQPTD